MSNELEKEILFRSIEIIINSAKSLILDEWDGVIYYFSHKDKVSDVTLKDFASEFILEDLNESKIYLTADREVIKNLSLKLYGIELSEEDDDDLIQDSLNELLNFFVGNAARELESLGLDFIESLTPTAANFESNKNDYENYLIEIPVDGSSIAFIYSVKIS